MTREAVKFCDETFIAVARVLVFYRHGQIKATGQGDAYMRQLRKRFAALSDAKTEEQIELALDYFDPVKKEEEMRSTYSGDMRPIFTQGVWQ